MSGVCPGVSPDEGRAGRWRRPLAPRWPLGFGGAEAGGMPPSSVYELGKDFTVDGSGKKWNSIMHPKFFWYAQRVNAM